MLSAHFSLQQVVHQGRMGGVGMLALLVDVRAALAVPEISWTTLN